jgi:hypothetical protein
VNIILFISVIYAVNITLLFIYLFQTSVAVNTISLKCHINYFYIILNNQDTERFFLFPKGVLRNSRVPRCAGAGSVMKLPTITNFFHSCSQIIFPFTRMQPCSSSSVCVCVCVCVCLTQASQRQNNESE